MVLGLTAAFTPGNKMNNHTSGQTIQGLVIAGEASESDSEEEIEVKNKTEECELPTKHSSNFKYDSLLHRKLRERNASLREKLVLTFKQPIVEADMTFQATSQNVIKAHMKLQDTSVALRKISGDLFNLKLVLNDVISNKKLSCLKS